MTARAYRPETLRDAFARVIAGVDPHIALGDFIDGWRRVEPAERDGLVADPLPDFDASDARMSRWAAFFAATADWLSVSETGSPRPPWTGAQRFRLAEPWFLETGNALRAWLLVATPAAFKSRNVFCGDYLFRRA